MKVIATYNLKGGVGKTAAAVNLAYLAARDGLQTLLWDLDAQGAASYYLRISARVAGGGAGLIERKKNLARAIRGTDYDGLDLVPADFSLRNLDLELSDYKKSTLRLRKLLNEVRGDYDMVFLDCAPTMSVVSENVFNMADVLLVPLIPTHLSLRAFDQLLAFRAEQAPDGAEIVPFFSMVDRRKRLHRELIVEFAGRYADVLPSFIPYTSSVEQMGERRAPVNAFADASAGGRAFRGLWETLVHRLAQRVRERDARARD
ncbi:MAG: ParA family protein [Gammaproteobacteria bacterium]